MQKHLRKFTKIYADYESLPMYELYEKHRVVSYGLQVAISKT